MKDIGWKKRPRTASETIAALTVFPGVRCRGIAADAYGLHHTLYLALYLLVTSKQYIAV